MTLSTGTKIGRYEIRSKIGEGGMGEVYLALDTELDRTVAIKILPEALASDQQRLQRFIQEAKAASALNHPHILTIHEIGTTETTRFIATEFIDGDTLRRRIRNGSRACGPTRASPTWCGGSDCRNSEFQEPTRFAAVKSVHTPPNKKRGLVVKATSHPWRRALFRKLPPKPLAFAFESLPLRRNQQTPYCLG